MDALRTVDLDRPVLQDSVAAVSVGVIDGEVVCDLDYPEDHDADVDMNIVMTGKGQYIEVQGTAEGQTFGRDVLDRQLELAEQGIMRLTTIQRESLGDAWPF